MMEELRLGTAKINMTPAVPVPLAGFADRVAKGNYEGVSHPIYSRICYMQHRDGEGRLTSVLLVSADFLWWGSERVPDLKRRIRERWGLEEDAVILHATHSHSGPQMSEQFSSYLGKPDLSYIEHTERQLLDGIGEALSNMETVTVERGRGECRLGINRRVMDGETCVMAPNEQGEVDHELTVIRYRTIDDPSKTKAVLVHYACHPVITRENKLSSEFTGVAMERLEDALGEHVVCAYMQGACGDINPYKEGGFLFGSNALVVEAGDVLAEAVFNVLDQSMEQLPAQPLTAIRQEIPLPLQTLPAIEELERNASLTNEIGEWSRMLLQSPERRTSSLPFEMTCVTLAEGLSFIAMNGEVVTHYGLFIKELSKGQTLPVGYTNGMIGYIPAARHIQEGGYEAATSIPYFHMPAPFQPSIDERIYEAVRRFPRIDA